MLKTIALLCLLLAAGTAGAQPGVQLGRAFTQTPEGNWHTFIKDSSGAETEFVFVPPAKFSATIDAELGWTKTIPKRATYEYTISNQRISQQGIVILTVRDMPPGSEAIKAPGQWDIISLNSVLAAGKNVPVTVSLTELTTPPYGIRPGMSDTFALQSAFLPGVITVEASGDTVRQTEVSPDMTPRQYSEFQNLLKQFRGVRVPAIGPRINPVPTETLLARVSDHYKEAFRIARHPQAGSFPETSADDRLAKLRQISAAKVEDRWHRQLSYGLRFCLDEIAGPK